MRASFRSLFVLTALAALLAVPAVAGAYAPDQDEFVNCIRTTDVKIECVVEKLNSPCLSEVVATRAKEAVMAAAERQREQRDAREDRGRGGPRDARGNNDRGNGNGPPVHYDFHVDAKPGEGDIDVTIECGPRRVRGVLVASQSTEPLPATGNQRGAAIALAGVAGLVLALGAGELVASRRRRHG